MSYVAKIYDEKGKKIDTITICEATLEFLRSGNA